MEDQKPLVCLFRLGREEFPGGLEDALKWVEEILSKTGLFKFRSHRPRGLSPGSVAIFSIEGKAFAEAILEESIRKTTEEERESLKSLFGYDYTHIGRFSPRSVRLYPSLLETVALERSLGIKLGRQYTYLSPYQYLQILKAAYARGA